MRQIQGRLKFVFFVLILLVLFLILPVGFKSKIKNTALGVVYPPIQWTHSFFKTILRLGQIPGLLDENRRLKAYIQQMEMKSFDTTELDQENRRLRELLEFPKRVPIKLRSSVAAQVIGRSPAGWQGSLILNKGSRDGIRLNMPVMSVQGLVGKIAEVSKTASRVRLISHPEFRVGGLIQRTRHTGIVFGTSEGEVRIKYLALDADIQKGDVVESAGYSKAFPKGVPIGMIDEVWKEPGRIFKVASIHLFVDLDRLEEVVCIYS